MLYTEPEYSTDGKNRPMEGELRNFVLNKPSIRVTIQLYILFHCGYSTEEKFILSTTCWV